MTVLDQISTDSPTPDSGGSRPRLVAMLAAATIAAAVPVLVGTAPANAGATAAAVAASSTAAGDVLFWSRSTDSTRGYSIAKASAAAPALVATVLAGHDAPAFFSDPEVSPDGTKLAYIRDVTNSIERTLEVRDLVSGAVTVLVTGGSVGPASYSLGQPTWSPDGDTIAYVHTRDTNAHPGPNPEVRVVAAAGGPSRLVDDDGLATAWQPDGKLTVARFDPGNGSTTGLWITGTTPNNAVLIPGSVGATDHAWSPNGSRVAFATSRQHSSGNIETLPGAGGTPTVIVAANNDCNSSPVWSSDAQRVLYANKTGECFYRMPSQIRQVAAAGGPISTIVSGGYNLSPSVTTKVAAPVPSESHDFNGDGYADVIGRMPNGDLRVYHGNGVGLAGYRRVGTGWGGMTAIFSPGDFDGEGHPDVIGRLPNGDLRLYTGVGGGPGGSQRIGSGFGGMTAIFSPGDFTGDGHPDVIARATSGELRLYPGNGVRVTGGTVIGVGWNGITAVFSPGDFSGDGKPDVIGRTSTGELRVYYGTGTTLSGSSGIGTGWNGLSALFSPGDFNLDTRPDVIGRMPNGDLRAYYGTGTRLSSYRTIGTGWNAVNPIL